MENWQEYISINPNIRFGKPCINDTRITVGDILGWYAAGMSEEEIIYDFPELKPEHLKAALFFAAARESSTRTLKASV